jgi:hypothetical protein
MFCALFVTQRRRRAKLDAEQLIARNIKAHTVDGYTAAHAVQYAHENTIRDLVAEVGRLKGLGQEAANGCVLFTVPLEDAEILVEFEIEPAEGDGWEEPRYERSITATSAFVNGVWVSASSFQLHVTEQWEALATEMLDDEEGGNEDGAA